MSTLPIDAPRVPEFAPLAILARVASAVRLFAEAFADAQEQARAAHERYPFAEW